MSGVVCWGGVVGVAVVGVGIGTGVGVEIEIACCEFSLFDVSSVCSFINSTILVVYCCFLA